MPRRATGLTGAAYLLDIKAVKYFLFILLELLIQNFKNATVRAAMNSRRAVTLGLLISLACGSSEAAKKRWCGEYLLLSAFFGAAAVGYLKYAHQYDQRIFNSAVEHRRLSTTLPDIRPFVEMPLPTDVRFRLLAVSEISERLDSPDKFSDFYEALRRYYQHDEEIRVKADELSVPLSLPLEKFKSWVLPRGASWRPTYSDSPWGRVTQHFSSSTNLQLKHSEALTEFVAYIHFRNFEFRRTHRFAPSYMRTNEDRVIVGPLSSFSLKMIYDESAINHRACRGTLPFEPALFENAAAGSIAKTLEWVSNGKQTADELSRGNRAAMECIRSYLSRDENIGLILNQHTMNEEVITPERLREILDTPEEFEALMTERLPFGGVVDFQYSIYAALGRAHERSSSPSDSLNRSIVEFARALEQEFLRRTESMPSF